MNNLTLLFCSFIRDHPKTIRQRFRSVFVVSLMSPLYVWLWADGTSDETVRLQIVYTVKPLFTDTRLIWTSHYYGQFAFSLRKESPNIFSELNPLNVDTFYGPPIICVNGV